MRSGDEAPTRKSIGPLGGHRSITKGFIMKTSQQKAVESVKMTVTLPREVAAFLRWKAEVEGMKRDELLRKIIVHYAKKLRKEDFRTPPISD